MMRMQDLYSIRHPLTGKKTFPTDDGLRIFEGLFGSLKARVTEFVQTEVLSTLSQEDIVHLCGFAYVQAARNPHRPIYRPAVWERAVRDAGFKTEQRRPNWFRSTLQALAANDGQYNPSMSSYVVRRIASKPIAFLPLEVANRIHLEMGRGPAVYFLKVPSGECIITGDNPCLSSKEGVVASSIDGRIGVLAPKEELFMPLRPDLAMFITPSNMPRIGIGHLTSELVETLNRFIALQSYELVVSQHASLPRTIFEGARPSRAIFVLDDLHITKRA